MTSERNQSREPWTADQLKVKLEEQIYFLRSSCKDLDSGVNIEAIRVATTLRTLLHLTHNQKTGKIQTQALLDMLGHRDAIIWMDQSIQGRGYFTDGNMNMWIEAELENGEIQTFPIVPQNGLAELVNDGGGPRYVPAFQSADRREQFVPFEEWWGTRFINAPDGSILSRRDLVLDLTNRDGGGHVDTVGLPHDYSRLKAEGHGIWWSDDPNSAGKNSSPLQRPSSDVAAASIRHIAHELLLTLSHHGVIEKPYS